MAAAASPFLLTSVLDSLSRGRYTVGAECRPSLWLQPAVPGWAAVGDVGRVAAKGGGHFLSRLPLYLPLS